jgi:hypothetical protein
MVDLMVVLWIWKGDEARGDVIRGREVEIAVIKACRGGKRAWTDLQAISIDKGASG